MFQLYGCIQHVHQTFQVIGTASVVRLFKKNFSWFSVVCAALAALAQSLTWLACEHAGKHHHGAAKHGHGAYSALLCCLFVCLFALQRIKHVFIMFGSIQHIHQTFSGRCNSFVKLFQMLSHVQLSAYAAVDALAQKCEVF